MEFNLEFPTEILSIVFQELETQDLISCSRTCWPWNATANSLLYETVSFYSHTKLQQFVGSITGSQTHHEKCVESSISSHQPLGQLVKSVEIITGYSHHDDIHSYSTMLSRLASKTPNVHASYLGLPILSSDTDSGLPFDWSNLASQWTKLTNLSLKGSFGYELEPCDLNNINDVFNRLQHLNITRCEDILTHMLPSLPTMPYLQSFTATVYHTDDYQALKKILLNCQNTLHTLIIDFHSYLRPLSVNLDDFKIGRKQLKAFGLMKYDDSQINITNFGDNLEHLEWWVYSKETDETLKQSIHKAMIKTSSLKTLSFAGNMALDHIPLVLDANKNCLHTFYFDHMDGNDLIARLQARNARLYNVTTLCFECMYLENSDIRALAEIFPNVEFLALCRNRRSREMTRTISSGSKRTIWRLERGEEWIATDALSHFQHLKALDKITFPELMDQSISTYQQCKILRPKHKGQPSVIPL
ncbi:hypothetical protein INT44_003064 [Umbelopsis vinacea]|uniref:F-box domain-containing protein n=1 Tax=Umbelopsis vinacea TaxID=44442 RepID=A0A8H7Q7V6_9FUNG|nr:hypothetical protein INT44_003064 [Umbelopsis vinacea]